MNLQVPAIQLNDDILFETRFSCPLVARNDDNRLVLNHVPNSESCDKYRLTLPDPVINPQCLKHDVYQSGLDEGKYHQCSPTNGTRVGHGNMTTVGLASYHLLLHCDENGLVCSSLFPDVTENLPLKTETRIALTHGPVYQLECASHEPHGGSVLCGVRHQLRFVLYQLEGNSTKGLQFSLVDTQEFTEESPVCDFAFNPVIKGEYCITTKNALEVLSLCENRKHGTTYKLCDLEPFQCCYGSHPKSVLLWQPDGIHRLDTRSSKTQSLVSFKRAKWLSSYNVQQDEILHCGTRSTMTNSLYGASQKSVFVWDERMGNYPLDRMSHHMDAPPTCVTVTRFGNSATDFVLLANLQLASLTGVGVGRPTKEPFGLLTSPAIQLEPRELPSLRDSLREHNMNCRGLDDEVQIRYIQPFSGVCSRTTAEGVGIFTATGRNDVFYQDVQRNAALRNPVNGFTDRWMLLAADSDFAKSGFRLNVTELYTSSIPKEPRPLDEESAFKKVRTKLPKRVQKFQNLGYYTDEHSTAMVAVWDSNRQQHLHFT